MKLSPSLALLAGCLSRVCAWSHVGETELREALASQDYKLVAFTYPNQRPSEGLEKEWAEVSKADPDGHIVSVDCAANPKFCEDQGVASFPAIRLYQQGEKQFDRYRGPRRAASIREFLSRAARPAISTVTEKNLTSFGSVDDHVFVAQLGPKDAVMREQFETMAKKYRDRFSFGVMASKSGPAVSCYNKLRGFEHVQVDFSQVDSLQLFIKECTAPLIPELTRRNEMEHSMKGKSFVHYFISSAEERDEYLAEMSPLAEKYEEYLQFTTIDVTEYPEMLNVYGHPPGSSKVLSVYHQSNGQVFPQKKMKKPSAAVVEEFLLNIIDGKITPWNGELPGGTVGHEEL